MRHTAIMMSDSTERTLRKNPHGKIGPNDPCWCESGKKYKRCHRAADQVGGERSRIPLRRRFVRPSRPDMVTAGSVSPMRPVPDDIERPDYAATGRPRDLDPQLVKSREDVERMRRASRMGRDVLDFVVEKVRAGITTEELDALAHEEIVRRGAYPSPLNYHNYPKSICTSVNEVICHGIPDSRELADGDIVNCDVTVFVEGMHGDTSRTVLVGDVDDGSKKLVDVTFECMMLGIGTVRHGSRLNEIGRAIETEATRHGYSVVRAFVGHGIGPVFHMDPHVPHYFDVRSNLQLQAGMTFTVEPMINLGTWRHVLWDDQWTAVTEDLERSAQFEHTVLVTEKGVEVLTLSDGDPQPFAH